MNYDENEMLIKSSLNKVNTPEYDFKREVTTKIITRQRPMSGRRKMNIGVIAVIIVILSGTVLASTLPSINRLINIISPEMGKMLQPIQEEKKDCEVSSGNKKDDNKSAQAIANQGIEIKPLAVVNDEDMAIIYLAIQDLEENRIDATLSLGEYFIEGGTIHNAQLIDYDELSKTAIVQVTTQGGQDLNENSMDIVIKSLLTSKKEISQLPIKFNLSDITVLNEEDTVWMTREETQGGGGTGDMWNILEDVGRVKLLEPNQMQIDLPKVEGVTITNMGYIDGRLHIQTKWEENDKDRHGYFYLTDQQGEKIETKENNFYFGVDVNNGIQFGSQYVEYILDIGEEEIKQANLMGYFAENGQVIEGEWALEVELDAVGDIIKIPSDIQVEGWKIEEVSLSPLGVTLKGKGTVGEKVSCSILMQSGEIREFDSISTSNQAGDIIVKLGVQVPLEVSLVTSIQIGKDIIDLN